MTVGLPAETQWDTSYTDHAAIWLCVGWIGEEHGNTQSQIHGMVCVRSVSLSFSRYSHLLCPNDLNVCVLAFDLISVTVWAKEGFFGFPFLRPWRFLVLISNIFVRLLTVSNRDTRACLLHNMKGRKWEVGRGRGAEKCWHADAG